MRCFIMQSFKDIAREDPQILKKGKRYKIGLWINFRSYQ